MALAVEIVTRTAVAWRGEAEEVQAPGLLGEFGVLPGHALYLAALRPGVVTVHGAGGATERFVVGAGFAEVGPDRVTLLVDNCERAEEVDREAAAAALEEAERALAEAEPGSDAHERARAAAEMARARLEA